jgi:hypothetical protein
MRVYSPPERINAQRVRRCRQHAVLIWVALLSIFESGVLACSGDTLNGPPVNADNAYWALRLNHHAVNLALTPQHDTVQLSATPVNFAGSSLNGIGTVTYTVADPTLVTVSSTGLVTAHAITSETQVIATLRDQQQGVTHADTVNISVAQTEPPEPFSTFSLQPAPGDSAKRSFDFGGFLGDKGQFAWPVQVTDATHAPVSLETHYTSSNPNVATIDAHTGNVNIVDTGHVVFTATTLAYGKPLRDSVAFTIGYTLLFPEKIVLMSHAGSARAEFLARKRVILGVGATVLFECSASNNPLISCGQPVDVVFDHPATIDSTGYSFIPSSGRGNIPAFGGDTLLTFADYLTDFRARRFPVPGVYRYYSTVFPSDTFEIEIRP